MVAKVYDMMLCQDGVTRAVEVVDGSPVDPSYVNQWKKPKEEKKEKPKVNIQQRIREQMEDYIGEIEGKVDDYIESGYKLKYDCYAHLNTLGCKSVHARKMRPFYVDCYNELVDVYNKDDEYYVEAWSHLKPKYHKKMMDYYGVICDDIDRLIKNATAQRKPRKKKTLSATRLVSKLKYQKELLLEDAKKSNEALVTNAWSNFKSSKSFLTSVQSQVKAAEIANEGITQEY